MSTIKVRNKKKKCYFFLQLFKLFTNRTNEKKKKKMREKIYMHEFDCTQCSNYKKRLLQNLCTYQIFFHTADSTWLYEKIKYSIFLFKKNCTNIFNISEALHVAHLMAAYGYFFPIDDHSLTVKNDNTFYRFQTPYFWPSNCWEPENTDYGKFDITFFFQGELGFFFFFQF